MQANIHTIRQVGIQTDRQPYMLANTHIDREAGRQTGKQRYIHKYTQADSYTLKYTFIKASRQTDRLSHAGGQVLVTTVCGRLSLLHLTQVAHLPLSAPTDVAPVYAVDHQCRNVASY